MLKLKLTTLIVFASLSLFAQTNDTIPTDGYLHTIKTTHIKPIPLPEIKQSDIFSVLRIWRDIDLSDKRNKFLGDPQARLIDVIFNGLDDGSITAYDANPSKADPSGDSFKVKLTPAQAHRKFIDSIRVDKIDKNGDKIGMQIVANTFDPDSVTRFRIKEDYIANKNRSVVEVRIIGIAPLVKIKVDGQTISEQPAFWIYFPQARNTFVNSESAFPGNVTLSFDDVFIIRKFYGRIVKESNPGDLRIKDYTKTPAEAEMEAARIEAELKKYSKNYSK